MMKYIKSDKFLLNLIMRRVICIPTITTKRIIEFDDLINQSYGFIALTFAESFWLFSACILFKRPVSNWI